MNLSEFEGVVRMAIHGLPAALRSRIENVQVVIRDAARSKRQRGRRRDESRLYGLYEGTALPERSPEFQGALPDRITLFKNSIEEDFPDPADMVKCIQDTVLHELGHYFGLDDEDLDRLGLG